MSPLTEYLLNRLDILRVVLTAGAMIILFLAFCAGISRDLSPWDPRMQRRIQVVAVLLCAAAYFIPSVGEMRAFLGMLP